MKIITTCTLLLFFGSITLTYGQSEKFMNTKAKWLEKKYGKIAHLEWEEDSHGNYEAQFNHSIQKYRVDFTKEGKWIESERSLEWKDLPKAVKDEVLKEYERDEIDEIEWVDSAKDGIYYEVEIKDKGKNIDLQYRKSGKRLD